MKITSRSGMTLVAFAALTASAVALAQPESGKSGHKATKQNHQRVGGSEWQQQNPLSEQSKDLAKSLVGKWETSTSMWMTPGQPPMVTTGTAVFDPIMGARFIKETFESKMGEEMFKGEGLFGFNTVSKEYETTWVDSSATGIMLSTGHKDAKGNLVFSGQYDDPQSGQRTTAKSVLHFEGHDKLVFTLFNKGTDGTETRSLEVVYTRSMPSGKMVKPEVK
jgi:hypothetical protein